MTNKQTSAPSFITIAGGRIHCLQCDATSKRTGVQCRAAALSGKTKCASHGGRSTGPKTAEGKARIAAAQLVHGRDTRQARINRSIAMKELERLARAAKAIRLIK